jgi:hypothetical protein
MAIYQRARSIAASLLGTWLIFGFILRVALVLARHL